MSAMSDLSSTGSTEHVMDDDISLELCFDNHKRTDTPGALLTPATIHIALSSSLTFQDVHKVASDRLGKTSKDETLEDEVPEDTRIVEIYKLDHKRGPPLSSDVWEKLRDDMLKKKMAPVLRVVFSMDSVHRRREAAASKHWKLAGSTTESLTREAFEGADELLEPNPEWEVEKVIGVLKGPDAAIVTYNWTGKNKRTMREFKAHSLGRDGQRVAVGKRNSKVDAHEIDFLGEFKPLNYLTQEDGPKRTKKAKDLLDSQLRLSLRRAAKG